MPNKKMALISSGNIINTAVWDGSTEWNPGFTTGEITSRRLKIGQTYVSMEDDSTSCNVVIDGSSLAYSTPPKCVENGLAELGLIPDTIVNVAVGGRTITTLITTAPSLVDTKYSEVHGEKNICMFWEIINEINLGSSIDEVFGKLTTYCTARKARGFKNIVSTCLPWHNSGEAKNTVRLGVNALILAAAGQGLIDAVADIASDVVMGDPATCLDTTYYSDGTHPTIAGQNLLKVHWKTAFSSLA